MTVSSTTTPRQEHNGNGSTVNFPITFPYANDSDVIVIHVDGNSTETTWIDPTNYSISGGAVVAVTAPAVGEKLVIYRETTKTQEQDLKNNRRLPGPIEEAALDKLTHITQELDEAIGRCIRYSIVDGSQGTTADDIEDYIDTKIGDSVDATMEANVHEETASAGQSYLTVSGWKLASNTENLSLFIGQTKIPTSALTRSSDYVLTWSGTTLAGGEKIELISISPNPDAEAAAAASAIAAAASAAAAAAIPAANNIVTDLAADVTAAGGVETELVISNTQTLSAHQDIPENITLDIIHGGKIVLGNYNLTFNGNDPKAGLHQIFDASGSGVVSGLKETYPEWWKTNTTPGTTDMGAAINSAFSSCEEQGVIKFREGSNFASSIPVICPAQKNIEMFSPITYTGTSDITILTVGETGTPNNNLNLRLNVIRSNQSDWSSEDNIGVRLWNCNNCDVWLDNAVSSTINCQLISENAATLYNKFWLNYIIEGKIGLDIRTLASAASNQNLFLGGRFAVSPSVNPTLNRYGVRFSSTASYYANNNTFLGTNFEVAAGLATKPTEAIGALIEYGTQNRFIACRDESNTEFGKIENNSSNNEFEIAFGTGDLIDNSAYKNNRSYQQVSNVIYPDVGVNIFDTGAMHKTAINAGANVNIPKVNVGTSAAASELSYTTGLTINPTCIETTGSRSIGVRIDTSVQKQFIIRSDVEAGFGGRVAVRCYDAAGAVLTSADPNHPYVSGQAFKQFSYISTYGGCYSTGGDDTADIFFTVGDDVKSINVMQIPGTAVLKTRGFAIYSLNGFAATWAGYEEIVHGGNIGPAAPTIGTWGAGAIVYNVAPTAGGHIGWVCTSAGTPGTWKTFGAIST